MDFAQLAIVFIGILFTAVIVYSVYALTHTENERTN